MPVLGFHRSNSVQSTAPGMRPASRRTKWHWGLTLLAFLAGGLQSPESVSAQPLRKVLVTQSTADSVAFVVVYIARYNKFFEAEGLDVNLVITAGGGPDVAALISGQAQFTAAGPINQLALFQQGQRTLSVISFFDRLIGNLVIRKEIFEKNNLGALSIDERIKILKGLRISVTRLGSLTDMVARSYIRRAGLDPEKDTKIIGTTAGAPQIAALQRGEVDAAVATTPAAEQMVARGAGVMLVHNTRGEDQVFVPFSEQSILVRPDYAQQNPDVVRAFVRAMRKAEEWAHNHTSQEIAATMIQYVPSLEVGPLVEQIELVKEGIPRTGCLSQKGVEANIKLFESAGMLTKPIAWTDIATNQFLDVPCP